MSAIRVLRSAVCGTDLQLLNGGRPGTARILGHEGIGLLTRDGEPGFVAFNPVDANDPDVVLGHSYDGIFRSHLSTTASQVPELVSVSSRLVADVAPLIEPLAVALYAWDLMAEEVGPGSRVGIWGAGPAAAINVLLARSRGVEPVLFHGSIERIEELRRVLDVEIEHRVTTDQGNGHGAPTLDAAILCVPRVSVAAALSQARRHCRTNGVIDTYSGMNGDSALAGRLNLARRRNTRAQGPAYREQWRDSDGCHWLTGHRGTSVDQLTASAALLEASPDPWIRVVSDVIGLRELPRVLADMAGVPAGARSYPSHRLKVVVDHTLVGRRDVDARTTLAAVQAQSAGARA